MADFIVVDLTGARELQQAFKTLEKKAKRAVGRKGITAGSTLLMKRMRALAPVGKTGNLKRSIGRKYKRYGGVDVVIVGPRITEEASGQHAYIVEYGTKERFTEAGASRGVMPAIPFMRPAFAQTKAASVRKGEAAIKNAVDAEVRKAAR